ncbi:MAG TPA: hypothetical protein VI757_06985, partial [Bacteroidia bacterium]|nr:hypothetical protein [Bacteroidia bacterium]
GVVEAVNSNRPIARIINNGNNNYAFLELPLDDTPMRDYAVCQICFTLAIEIPDACKHYQALAEHIKNTHK